MDKKSIIGVLNHAYFSEHPDEEEALRALPYLIKNCRSFVDVGASLGQYTKLASFTIKNARIVAIEADPLRFEELEKNCQKWSSVTGNNITAKHLAISSSTGAIKFQITNSMVSGALYKNDLSHLDSATRNAVNWQEIEVRSQTMDSLFENYVPDFVKMDIEGAEYLALQGAKGLLAKGKTSWLIELHNFTGEGGGNIPKMVITLMKQYGYGGVDFYGKVLFVREPWRRYPWRKLVSKLRGLKSKMREIIFG